MSLYQKGFHVFVQNYALLHSMEVQSAHFFLGKFEVNAHVLCNCQVRSRICWRFKWKLTSSKGFPTKWKSCYVNYIWKGALDRRSWSLLFAVLRRNFILIQGSRRFINDGLLKVQKQRCSKKSLIGILLH